MKLQPRMRAPIHARSSDTSAGATSNDEEPELDAGGCAPDDLRSLVEDFTSQFSLRERAVFAMFVIEGLGTALAGQWADKLRGQLGLHEDQVRFLRYHGAADDDHFAVLARMLRSDLIDRERAGRIVRTAEVVARLYAWQLEEVTA